METRVRIAAGVILEVVSSIDPGDFYLFAPYLGYAGPFRGVALAVARLVSAVSLSALQAILDRLNLSVPSFYIPANLICVPVYHGNGVVPRRACAVRVGDLSTAPSLVSPSAGGTAFLVGLLWVQYQRERGFLPLLELAPGLDLFPLENSPACQRYWQSGPVPGSPISSGGYAT